MKRIITLLTALALFAGQARAQTVVTAPKIPQFGINRSTGQICHKLIGGQCFEFGVQNQSTGLFTLDVGSLPSIPFSQLPSIASGNFIGNPTAGAASVQAMSPTQSTALLSPCVGDSGSGGTKGLVPAPPAGSAASGYVLGAGCTWQAPTASGGLPTVVSYGADPTGTTDSTTAFTSALAANKAVRVPSGNYLVRNFTIPANTSLLCDNPTSTTLSRASSVTTPGVYLVTVGSGASFSGCTVDGNGATWGQWVGAVTNSASVSNTKLSHLVLQNFPGDGLLWAGSISQGNSNAYFDDITVQNVGLRGARITGVYRGVAKSIKVISAGLDAIEAEDNTGFVWDHPIVDKSAPPTWIYYVAGTLTSSTSNTIGTGSQTFSIAASQNLVSGQYVCFVANSTTSECGNVTSYSGTTLVVNMTTTMGSGAYSSWNLAPYQGMMIWRGVRNYYQSFISPVCLGNAAANQDGIGIGEVGVTSTSSVTIGTGSKTFVVSASGIDYPVGAEVTAFVTSNPSQRMVGYVTSYSGTTLVINSAVGLGSGTYASWQLNTEPGPEFISDALVENAGLFGIDLASNSVLNGAYIYNPKQRGLEIGLDLGGVVQNVSASNVTSINAGGGTGAGLYVGNGSYEYFYNINLLGFNMNSNAYGIEVNTNNSIFTNIYLDNKSSHYSNNGTPYLSFGSGTDPQLNVTP